MQTTELILFITLVASALLALELKNLVASVLTASAYSFIIALLYIRMGAVDVAFTEAVVGAAIVGIFWIAAIVATTQRSSD